MFTGCGNDAPLVGDVSEPEYTEEIQSLLSNEDLMEELNSRFMTAFGNYDTDDMSVFLTFDENTVMYVVGLTNISSLDDDYDEESIEIIIDFDMDECHDGLNDVIDWLRRESGFDNLILRVMYITADSTEIVRYDYPREVSV